MPRNDGPSDGLLPIGEDLEIKNAGKLDSFDNITSTLEAILAGVVTGKATRFQIAAATAIVQQARENLVSKAQFQKQIEALREQGYEPVIENGKIIAAPTLLQRTGTPFRRTG